MLTGSHERLVKDACCHSTGCEVVEAPKRETVRHIHVMRCDRDISRVDRRDRVHGRQIAESCYIFTKSIIHGTSLIYRKIALSWTLTAQACVGQETSGLSPQSSNHSPKNFAMRSCPSTVGCVLLHHNKNIRHHSSVKQKRAEEWLTRERHLPTLSNPWYSPRIHFCHQERV